MKKTKSVSLILIITLVIGLLCACGEKSAEPVVPASTEPQTETISVIVVGDNLLHMPVVNSGKRSDGTYGFSHLFEKIQPAFRDADIAVIGQETVFGGEDLGYSGFPLFNSPSDMGKTLVDQGFDVVLHASNHVFDKWDVGVENTLEFWKDYKQVTVLGINESPEDKGSVDVMVKKGAKIAMLNYTYDTNGIPAPKGKEYLVNYIDEEKIQRDVAYAEANTDFTVAFMHWGTEYSTKPNDSQKKLAQKMCDWGVDLIVGAHPHVIEPMEWLTSENGNKTLVYYSLGNYVSRQKESRNLLGAMADVKLEYDGKTVKIAEHSFVPIVTHYNSTSTQFSVYRLSEYNDGLASVHGVVQYDGPVSVEKWRNTVAEIFDGYDMSAVEGF